MGERYWITGAQLGMLTVISKVTDREKISNKVIEDQFIGNFETIKDKASFVKQVKKVR